MDTRQKTAGNAFVLLELEKKASLAYYCQIPLEVGDEYPLFRILHTLVGGSCALSQLELVIRPCTTDHFASVHPVHHLLPPTSHCRQQLSHRIHPLGPTSS